MGLGSDGWTKPLLAFGSLILAIGVGTVPAQARHRHHRSHTVRVGHVRHSHHLERRRTASLSYAPPYSAIVVDAPTGRTLYSDAENELRHPASLTKVMTLYLLFEQFQKGRLTPDTMIEVSPHAASMEPDKLGLRPGSHIRLDDAIRAIVTKSANDMAVAIGEAVGGNESHFAELMTAKAHELGMTRTQYVNASGLPDDRQLTTAHDLALLGRSIQERFPQYFKYFSLQSFRYAGSYMASHDHLLGHVDGVDGIKTGYTRASGYNLLTDVRRGDRHIVAVILGGTSWRSRDLAMERLVADHIAEASPGHGLAPVSVDAEQPAVDDERAAPALEPPTAHAEPVRLPIRSAALETQTERLRPAVVGSAPKEVSDETPVTDAISQDQNDGSTRMRVDATATPSPLRWTVGPQPVRDSSRSAPAARPVLARTAAAERPATEDGVADAPAPASHRPGIQIQVGATDDMDQAKSLLEKAANHGHGALARATPYTEKFEKGGSTFWRARFAGLDSDQAQAACRQLKRSGIACFTIKD
jgi:D-alanyl-D-alanine carboxypeptidase